MDIQFVYQSLTEEQKQEIIRLWVNAGVVNADEAVKRVDQVSVIILSTDKIVGVSTVYPGFLDNDEKPWFFFRMFIEEKNRGSNQLRTQIMQLNFSKLKNVYDAQFQGIVLELENTKLAKLAETTDYMRDRGYSYYGKNSRNLSVWYIRFNEPKGIFAGLEPLNVLKIIGIPDDNYAKVLYNDGVFAHFSLFFDGNSSFLEKNAVDGAKIETLYIGGETYPAQFQLKHRPNVIVNMICDPEIHTRSLSILNNISSTAPMINRADLIHKTSRDLLSEQLRSKDSFYIPKTIRITPSASKEILERATQEFDGKCFLFRPVVSHGGEGLIKVDEYTSAQFDRYSINGNTQYFMTEFIDYRNTDGLYRKMRFFVINGIPYARHKIVSESWMIHSQNRSSLMSQESYQEEEKNFLENPPVILETFCHYLYDHLKLDYFGIDCALLDNGTVVLFEANVCMRPYGDHDKEYLKKANMLVRDAFKKLLYSRSR